MRLRTPKFALNGALLRGSSRPTFLSRLRPVTGGAKQPQVDEAVIVTRDNVVNVCAGGAAQDAPATVSLDDLTS